MDEARDEQVCGFGRRVHLKWVEVRVVDSGSRLQRLRGFLGEKVDSGFEHSWVCS